MERIFTFFFIITLIMILYMPFIKKSFFPTIFIIKLGFIMSAFLKIALGCIMVLVSNEVLVEITFLVVLVIEIDMLFIFILVVYFMEAAGLLSFFVIRCLPITTTLLTTLSFIVAAVIFSYIVVFFFVPSFGIIMF